MVTAAALAAQASAIPVKPCTCYEATLRARVVQGPNIEDMPQMEDVLPMCVSRPTVLGVRFAAVQWRFLDAAGKPIPRPREGASPQTLFSRAWRMYRYRFWTPEGAAQVEFFPLEGAKGNKAEVADVTVREIPPPTELNFNGDFSAADDAAWGWQLIGSALFQNLAPGRSCVNTQDGHLNGDLFPVTPGGRIRLEAVCSDPVLLGGRFDHTYVRISFYAAYADASGGKQRGRMAEVPLSVKGRHAAGVKAFTVPEGFRWARISVWHGIVERVTARKE